ncbi:MAG TPA: Glu/Leu/Phe/Val dehydrogenase dimerization domain-containing protein [Acidimicrobiales bacterium]|nr:Glu/Leu/Phe/Val dehydrogenase dimerization domain-containing protein [Acidimicrobiales bacterium]
MKVMRGPAVVAGTEVIAYVDPVEGFRGWLAFSGGKHRLAAGGFRVQPGLDAATLARLAQTMELKERLLGLAVDGAKAGIDYDPRSPGKHEAMRRFLEFLRPHLLDRLSLGPDMGTTWREIENCAREIGLVSVKGAITHAQGLDEADFTCRIGLLDREVEGATLGARRAGHALAHAALAAVEVAGEGASGTTKIGIQGFGTLGRATATALAEAGLTPVAVTDEHTCLHHLTEDEPSVEVERPQRLLELPLDVLVLAACEDALDYEQAQQLDVKAVVVGANLGLSPAVEALLHRRGILVVPDFVGGCGGSASMDALFGPPTCPTPTEFLERLGARMRALVTAMFELSQDRGITPREAALAMADRDVPPGRPYGRWR